MPAPSVIRSYLDLGCLLHRLCFTVIAITTIHDTLHLPCPFPYDHYDDKGEETDNIFKEAHMLKSVCTH